MMFTHTLTNMCRHGSGHWIGRKPPSARSGGNSAGGNGPGIGATTASLEALPASLEALPASLEASLPARDGGSTAGITQWRTISPVSVMYTGGALGAPLVCANPAGVGPMAK